jgi:hypothetical protein
LCTTTADCTGSGGTVDASAGHNDTHCCKCGSSPVTFCMNSIVELAGCTCM